MDKRPTKYHNVKDGEWVTPTKKHKMACCDCGLVHDFTFRIVRIENLNGRPYNKLATQFKASRNDRATSGRRHKKSLRKLRKVLYG